MREVSSQWLETIIWCVNLATDCIINEVQWLEKLKNKSMPAVSDWPSNLEAVSFAMLYVNLLFIL